MEIGTRRRLLGAMLAALSTVWGPSTLADPIEDFYKGKQITLVIGSGPGGGYDAYGRLFANHFARHIPGTPTIVPENMPGASGTKSAQYLDRIAPKDGTVLGIFNQSMPLRQLRDGKAAKFDTRQFNWIGAMSRAVTVFITTQASGVKTLEDARRKEVILGALAESGSNAAYPILLNTHLGTRFKVVLGYEGGNTIQLAMERGEVEGRGSMTWAALKSGWPSWIQEKKINVILQIGLEKDSDLPDVPLLIDLAKDKTQEAIFRLISYDTIMGYPIVVPPGVAADKVAVLRRAFDATMKDPRFLAEAGKRGMLIAPSTGAEVQEVVAATLATSPDVVSIFEASLKEQKQDPSPGLR